MSRIIITITASIILACASTASAQVTWIVNDNAPNDPGPGNCFISDPLEDGSPAHPFDAIQEGVNAAVAGDTVLVLNGVYVGACGNQNITVPCQDITIESANGSGFTIIDGGGAAQAFIITGDSPDDPIIRGFTIVNCWTAIKGGAVDCQDCDPTFEDCVFLSNTANVGGGAVWLDQSDAAFIDCVFRGNQAVLNEGGAISVSSNQGAASATNCEFRRNSALVMGGAVNLDDAGMAFSQCNFSLNAALEGGAMAQWGDSTSEFDVCSFGNGIDVPSNTATTGGGLWIYGGSSTISASSFEDNEAVSAGGAIAMAGTSVTITDSSFERSAVTGTNGTGGAIYCFGGTLEIVNSQIEVNSASAAQSRGGGLYIEDNVPDGIDASAIIQDSLFAENTALWGGGGIFCSGADLDISVTDFRENMSTLARGGAIRHRDQAVSTIAGSTFNQNGANTDGGAIANSHASMLTIDTSSFTSNVATNGSGGGAHNTGNSTLSVDGGTFFANICAVHGGAINTSAGSTLGMANLELTNNTALAGSGGGVNAEDSNVQVNSCTFTNNVADLDGGGLFATGCPTVLVEDTTLISNTSLTGNGGGITAVASGIQVDLGTFTDNLANLNGGGLHVIACPPVTVENTTFTSNNATTGNGGGISALANSLVMRWCTFDHNTAVNGAGVTTAQGGNVRGHRCDFFENTATLAGGGAWHSGNPGVDTVEYKWSRFVGNSAQNADGGGAYVNTDSAFHNCGFAGNQAFGDGGGIKSYNANMQVMEVANCLFSCNSVGVNGGAVSVQHNGITAVINNTFSKNTAGAQAGGVYSYLGVLGTANNIFWENLDAGGNTYAAQISGAGVAFVANSCFTNPACPGVLGTNICANPMFADFDGPDNVCGNLDDDLTLLAGSPCIDAGDNNYVPIDHLDLDADGNVTTELTPLDLAWNDRFVDDTCTPDTGVAHFDPLFAGYPIIDMGAYEVPDCDPGCVADWNGDGTVDTLDFLAFLNDFAAGDPNADINGDGTVNTLDFLEFLNHFAAGC